MATLPEVGHIAALRNEQASISRPRRRAKMTTPEMTAPEKEQRLAAIETECMDILRGLEQRYGDGHYEERRVCLDDLLDAFEQSRIDLETVLSILRKAEYERTVELSQGWEVDMRRSLKTHGRLVQHVRHRLRELRDSYSALLGASHREFTILEDIDTMERSFSLMQRLDDLRADLGTDPLVGEKFLGPERRSKGGRPKQEWLKRLRRQLKAAGIPDDPEETLLRCTGFLPYRPLPPK